MIMFNGRTITGEEFGVKNFRKRMIMVVLALCGILLLVSCGKTGEGDVSGVLDRLRAMEAGDPDEVVRIIRGQQQERMAEELDQLGEQMLSGEVDVWSKFQDYVVLGDSRAVGFYYYEFLPHERVLADGGDTIRTLKEHIPDITALHPSRIYLAYGVNDINIGFWSTAEEYTTEMAETLSLIQEELPEVEIYVNSTLAVQDWALYKGDMWKYIPDWNEVIRQMCSDHGYVFVDNAPLTAEHQELYDADGIHMQRAFYPYWAVNMIQATYYREAYESMQ